MRLQSYKSFDAFDEMFAPDGRPRPSGARFVERLEMLSDSSLRKRQQAAERSLHDMGVTFNVYGHAAGTERVWPFDLLPRIIAADEWQTVENGLRQRIRALNRFIDDIYNERLIIKDRVIPESLIGSSKTLRKQCQGYRPPQGVFSPYRR